jgi:hypothetical protein
MIIPIPVPLLIVLLGVPILAIIFLIVWLGQQASRAKSALVGDVFALKPSRASRQVEWSIKPGLDGSKIIEALVTELEGLRGKTQRKDEKQAIVYFGSRTDAKMMGIWDVPPLKMPIRILIGVDSSLLRMRLDDDFGFQILLGQVKKRFQDRYNEAFDAVLGKLGKVLASNVQASKKP